MLVRELAEVCLPDAQFVAYPDGEHFHMCRDVDELLSYYADFEIDHIAPSEVENCIEIVFA